MNLNNVLPHPELLNIWEISKNKTRKISFAIILITIVVNQIFNNRIQFYNNEFKTIDFISISLSFLIFIQTKRNKIKFKHNSFFYKEEYKEDNKLIYVINFVIYGAKIRILSSIVFNYLNIFMFKNMLFRIDLNIHFFNNNNYIIIILYAILLYSTIFVLFKKNKVISIECFTEKMLILDEKNYINKNTKNYVQIISDKVLQLNKESFDQKKHNRTKQAKSLARNNNPNTIKNEEEKLNTMKKNNSCIKNNHSDTIKNKTNKYYKKKSKIPLYGLYVSEDNYLYINGRRIRKYEKQK